VTPAQRFGRNLFMARRRAGLSQQELADLASLHRTEIGLLENGRRVARIDTLAKLTQSLELSANDLMAGIEWMPSAHPRPGQFRESDG
jgi:transcriptional regulator with XRE-family HTH domain